MNHSDSSLRLSSYVSTAALVAAGAGSAHADLMIFDVGTTYTVSDYEGFGGPSIKGFETYLALGDFGSLRIGAGQVSYMNKSGTTGGEFEFFGWGLDGQSAIGVASFKGKADRFLPGGEVDWKRNFNYATSGATGGKFKSVQLDSKAPKQISKGVIEGQAYVGLELPGMGLGGTYHYGWLDVTVGLNENDDFFLTINRWAYESDAETAASIPGGTVVPGVGGLAALAFGAAGIRRRRERVA